MKPYFKFLLFITFYQLRIRSYPPMMINSHQFPRPMLPGSVRLSTTSLPARTQKTTSIDHIDVSTDEENDSTTNGRIRRSMPKSTGGGSRRSLPTTPPHYIPGGPNKFRFRNTGPSNGIRRLR